MTYSARAAAPPEERLRVLAVDDSAVAREMLRGILSGDPDLDVRFASDAFIALRRIGQQRPDVILLDLEMPGMDGLTFLRKVMAEDPIPVVICSGVAARGTRRAMDALDAGAVDVVPKPDRRSTLPDPKASEQISRALRAAAGARPARPQQTLPARPASDRVWEVAHAARPFQIVAIGASTGGPQALRAVLEGLPAASPPILIVQHMPFPFTTAMAERLDGVAQVRVREARSGDLVERGNALIAPGNRHMMLIRDGARYRVTLTQGPRVSGHRPSVDVLFRSIARSGAVGVLGVLLTGMGHDGAAGMLEMRRRGAATLAQDEASCAVFGMPRRALETGAAEEVLPLSDVARRIVEGRRRRRES